VAACAQVTPAQVEQVQNLIANHIEALTILGGDYGLAGGSIRSTGKFEFGGSTDSQLQTTKFGGAGDVGDPRQLDGLSVGWQPRVQGNMGFVQSTNRAHSTLLEGDVNEVDGFAIEFGGGARFWMNEQLSVAPTLMLLYGTTSSQYTANSAFARENLGELAQLGLINYSVDTLTLRPAINLQYSLTFGRTIITASSDLTYFHTESIRSSSASLHVSGDSATLAGTIDIDIPLGVDFLGHELRTGGYYTYTNLSGALRDGLNEEYLHEIHARLVLDVLNQLWKVQWIGIGASYVRGQNLTGWTAGADVTFRF
jgi:hypothetical protein